MMANKMRNESSELTLELNGCYPEVDSTGKWKRDVAHFVTHDDDEVKDSDMNSNDFEKAQKLGESDVGTVWKVVHVPTKLVMAKKTMTLVQNPYSQREIIKSLSFLRTCESPYIVSFYGAFLDDDKTTISICMEYCEGGSIEDIYKRAHQINGVIGEIILANIAEGVCNGLVFLRAQKIMRTSIKPSNIFMTRKGLIKLCDFGVNVDIFNPVDNVYTGTQYYCAPEIIMGAGYSVSSDTWSLGLILIEVAHNRPALPPPDQTHLGVFEIFDLIVHQPMPNVGTDRSIECQNFVSTCLIKDPEQRPTPKEMLNHEFIKLCADFTCNIEGWLQEVWG